MGYEYGSFGSFILRAGTLRQEHWGVFITERFLPAQAVGQSQRLV